MIKDLYNAQGNFVGHAMYRKKNSTVDVIYIKEAMMSNVIGLSFEEFETYKSDMELIFSDELPNSQVSLDDLL